MNTAAIIAAVCFLAAMCLLASTIFYKVKPGESSVEKQVHLDRDHSPNEKAYWQAKKDWLENARPEYRVYYATEVLPHGLFIQYRGTCGNEPAILFCLYDMRMLEALLAAQARIYRDREHPVSGFAVLLGDHPDEQLSAEAVRYMRDQNLAYGLCLTGHTSFFQGKKNTYAFVGVRRKKTMDLHLKEEKKLSLDVLSASDITEQALRVLKPEFDHRLLWQYRTARKKALVNLSTLSEAYRSGLLNSMMCDGRKAHISCAEEEDGEAMLTRLRVEGGRAGAAFLLDRESRSSGETSRQTLARVSKAVHVLQPSLPIVPVMFEGEEEAALERFCRENVSFLPKGSPAELIDYYESLLR